MKIYHNPNCSKSRKTLELIKSKTSDIQIIEYLKNPPTFKEIKLILSKLNMNPIELIRTHERIWKENYKKIKMNDEQIINVMTKYPKLIERPIVTNKKKAIIGRPPENVFVLFDQEGI